MHVLIDLVLPFFAIIAAGYVARWTQLLADEATSALNRFVYWIAMPPLLFRAMTEIDPYDFWNINFVGAYGGSVLLTMVLSWWVGRRWFGLMPGQAAMNSMNSAYGNTGFLGLPLSLVAFGEPAILPTVITVVINTVIAVAITTTIIEYSQRAASHQSVWQKVWLLLSVGCSSLKSPLIFSPLLGLAFATLDWTLPAPVERYCLVMGAAATPSALFCVGMFMFGKQISSNRGEVGVTCALKLLFQPLICAVLIMTLFPLSPLYTAVAVVMAATPTGAGSFVLAQVYRLYEVRTSSVILLSTVLSMLTLFLLLAHYLPIDLH